MPAGLTEIVPLFHPIALLIRELRRSDPKKREVRFAENGEISLSCQRSSGPTFATNILLVNNDQYPKPTIEIRGNDDTGVRCHLVRVEHHPNNIKIIIAPRLAYELNLMSHGVKLTQIKTVVVDTEFGRLTISNHDFRENSRPLRIATPSSG